MQQTAYINWLKQVTYPSAAIEAIVSGSIIGAWERLIARQILSDLHDQNAAAFNLVGDLQPINLDTLTELAARIINPETVMP
jgi:hypothetical protein